MLASRILRFARTNRCAIVASGTRNERAISSVSRPPRSRSVKAIWTFGANAGWQHVKISRRRSSFTGPTGSGGSSRSWMSAAWAYRSWRDDSRRSLSMARLRAVVVIHAPGFGGNPDSGQRCVGDDERLLDRLFGDVDVAEETDQRRDRTSGLVPEDAAELRIVQCWHDWSRRRVPCRDRPGKGGPRPGPCTPPSPSPPTPARRRDRRPR